MPAPDDDADGDVHGNRNADGQRHRHGFGDEHALGDFDANGQRDSVLDFNENHYKLRDDHRDTNGHRSRYGERYNRRCESDGKRDQFLDGAAFRVAIRHANAPRVCDDNSAASVRGGLRWR